MKSISPSLLALALVFAPITYAQEVPVTLAAREPTLLDTVVVTGGQPGPGLWHVTKGDNEMWILGSLWPLPSNITWNSAPVTELIASSQEVLWQPYFIIDAKAGFFAKLYLGYRMSQVEKNPDGKQLKDVLSPELYARWVQAKRLHLPNDRGVERKRPMLAADALFKAAIRQAGLGQSPIVFPPIRAVIQQHSIKSTAPHVSVTVTDPKVALKEAQATVLNDSACMEATLDAIEQNLPGMVTNANAWAIGDLKRISFAQLQRRERACADAFSDAEFARKRGIPNIPASMKAAWLEAADVALAKNSMTFAVLPLEEITGPDGYAERLRAKGYGVENP